MNEGERIVALIVGTVVGCAALFGLGIALWNQEGHIAVLQGTIVVLSGWLIRMAHEGLD